METTDFSCIKIYLPKDKPCADPRVSIKMDIKWNFGETLDETVDIVKKDVEHFLNANLSSSKHHIRFRDINYHISREGNIVPDDPSKPRRRENL